MTKKIWGEGLKFLNNQNLELEVIKYYDCYNVLVQFVDSGCMKSIAKKEILSGQIKDDLHPSVFNIGYIGQGHSSKHPAYKTWHSMLARCYDLKNQKPAYKGTLCCDEWHNFQNFANWYDQYPFAKGDGMQLDKDLRVIDNLCYSPSACSFVPNKINSSVIKFGGVHLNKRGKYVAQCQGVANRYVGSFDNYEAAWNAYSIIKKLHLNSLADYYQEWLHPEVIENLRNYVK